jgi:hypothetical protein
MVQQCLCCDSRVSIFNIGDNTGREVKLRNARGLKHFSKQSMWHKKTIDANDPIYLSYIDSGKGNPKQVT